MAARTSRDGVPGAELPRPSDEERLWRRGGGSGSARGEAQPRRRKGEGRESGAGRVWRGHGGHRDHGAAAGRRRCALLDWAVRAARRVRRRIQARRCRHARGRHVRQGARHAGVRHGGVRSVSEPRMRIVRWWHDGERAGMMRRGVRVRRASPAVHERGRGPGADAHLHDAQHQPEAGEPLLQSPSARTTPESHHVPEYTPCPYQRNCCSAWGSPYAGAEGGTCRAGSPVRPRRAVTRDPGERAARAKRRPVPRRWSDGTTGHLKLGDLSPTMLPGSPGAAARPSCPRCDGPSPSAGTR